MSRSVLAFMLLTLVSTSCSSPGPVLLDGVAEQTGEDIPIAEAVAEVSPDIVWYDASSDLGIDLVGPQDGESSDLAWQPEPGEAGYPCEGGGAVQFWVLHSDT